MVNLNDLFAADPFIMEQIEQLQQALDAANANAAAANASAGQAQAQVAFLQARVEELQQANANQGNQNINFAAAIANLQNAQNNGGGGDGGRWKVKMRDFDGKEEKWVTWKEHFLVAADVNGFNDTDKKKVLKALMSGDAAWQVQDLKLSLETYQLMDFNEYFDIFCERFEQCNREQARCEFDNVKQKSGESIEGFHNRLRYLHQYAFPDAEITGALEIILVRKFVAGLQLAEIRKPILQQKPETYAEVLKLAREQVSYNQSDRFFRDGKLPSKPLGASKAGGGGDNDFSMCSLPTGEDSGYGNEELAAMHRRGGTRSNECYSCGGKGHYASNCPSKKNNKNSNKSRQQQQGKRGPPMPKGGKKTQKPTGKGKGFRPAHGMHSMTGAEGDHEEVSGVESGEE